MGNGTGKQTLRTATNTTRLQPMPTQRKYYKPTEIAEMFDVNKYTVYAWIRKGRLEGYKIGRGIRITPEQLDRFMAAAKTEQTAEPTASGAKLYEGRGWGDDHEDDDEEEL